MVVKTYDLATEQTVKPQTVEVSERSVLIVDGVFLLRPQLAGSWTLSVHLRVSAQEVLRRALRRDVQLMGSEFEVRRRYEERYLPGQALYRAGARPEEAPTFSSTTTTRKRHD